MGYLVWINNLVVIKNGEEYDFLDEMYPEIKNKFNIIWALKNNIAKPIREDTRIKFNRIQQDIDDKLSILGMNNYILFLKKANVFIEPISGEEFEISMKSLKLKEVTDEEISEYISGLTNKNIVFLKTKLFEFKQKITSYQKRK